MAKIKEYKNKKGQTLFKFRYHAGIDPETGKKKYIKRAGFTSKKEAELQLKRLDYEVEAGIYTQRVKKRFRDVVAEWLDTYKLTVRESTYLNTHSKLIKHILPTFGDMYVDKVSVSYCQRVVNDWYKQYPSVAKQYTELTSRIFKYARKLSYVDNNPMDLVDKPRRTVKRKKDNYYTKDELNEFLTVVKNTQSLKVFACFRLLAFTGLRKGELLALTWEDIDFNSNTIQVNKTLSQASDTKLIVLPPKTKSSERVITVDSETIAVLRQWKVKQAQELLQIGIKSAVIFDNNGQYYSYAICVNEWLKKIYKDNPTLKRITPHGFRHTHSTLLIESEANIKATSQRLGHSNIQITLDTYTHVSPHVDKEIVTNLATYLA